MQKIYETVGEVRSDVDEALASTGLRAISAGFYPYTRALTFGLIDQNGNRQGNAYCPLPKGGWVANSYNPAFLGEPTVADDNLRLKVAKGVGKLVLPFIGDFSLSRGDDFIVLAGFDGVPYHLMNEGDELFVVHARSTEYPANSTDSNRFTTSHGLNDDFPLESERVFTHDQAFGSNGAVGRHLLD